MTEYPPDHEPEKARNIFALATRKVTEGYSQEEMTEAEQAAVIGAGHEFVEAIKNSSATKEKEHPCLVISAPLATFDSAREPPEDQVMRCCLDAFKYRTEQRKEPVNVLLDSPGGSLDCAFKIVRWLTWYSDELNIYVPRQAKSASTLLALGAKRVYLSPFGELGPLDTQISDPRNPAGFVSALDCYQSVDYVRLFGVDTMSTALAQLSDHARGQIALSDLLSTASSFGIGAIEPMLRGVRALDFGAWGRSLKIGERYAQILLQSNHSREEAERIARRFVYNYTHHLFPIDCREASDIGLQVKMMDGDTYSRANDVLDECHHKPFIRFVSPREEHAQRAAEANRKKEARKAHEREAGGNSHRPAGGHQAGDRAGDSRPAEPASARTPQDQGQRIQEH